MNIFHNNILKKKLEFIKLFLITLLIFFFDIKFLIFSVLVDLRIFSLLLFLIMIYEIQNFNKLNSLIYISLSIFTLLILHYFLNIIVNNIPINIYSITKIISFILISTSIYYYKEFILKNFNKIINIFLVIFFMILVIFNTISLFNDNFSINCFFGCFRVNRFLFLENSHLAYISSLIIFYYIFNSLKKENIKFFLPLLFFLISLIKNQSTTLLVSNILISFFLLTFYSKYLDKIKKISFVCIFIISTIFIFDSSNKPKYDTHEQKINDFINVITIEESTKNLSSAVYFFNSKIAFNSLLDMPFGWGLFNYQFAHQKYSRLVESGIEGSSWLNNNDGSNILFKATVEFGIFSFLLWLSFLFFLFNKKIDFRYKLLIAPPIITQVLIRGSGFFNGGFIVFLILYLYLLLKKN
jgi:hypothetical protein